MINNYNSSSYRISSRLNFRKPEEVGNAPDLFKSSRMSWLGVIMLFMFLTLGQSTWAQNTANYAFSTGVDASLGLDMNGNAVSISTGATSLVGFGSDQGVSSITNIGFNFTFMGTTYTQFSVSANGVLQLGSAAVSSTTYVASGGSSTSPKFGAITSDAITSSSADSGGVTSKVIGSVGNRTLVVQWISYLYYTNTASPATFQIRLYESTGVVEYVYGRMPVGSSAYSSGYTTGFSYGTTSGNLVSVATSTNSNSTSTFSSNTYSSGTNITNLHSTTEGSRRYYRYTPQSVVLDPTTLTFTAISASNLTPNWVDSSTNEFGFRVTRATDAAFTQNVVTTNVASTTMAGTGTTYNSPQTGLSTSTTYYYKVQALVEAGLSSGLTGSQATNAATTYYWVGTSGSTWNTPANWNTAADGSGSQRTTVSTTDILIVDGAGTVAGAATTISVDLASFSIGQFKVTNNTACTLQSSVTTTRTITITGSPGDDFVIESGCSLTTNHANNAVAFVFSGTGNTGNVAGVYTIGGNTSNSFNSTGGTGTVVTVTGTINNAVASATAGFTGSATTLFFNDGSSYNVSGATTVAPNVPLATWSANSNLNISGLTTNNTAPANSGQSFGNISYDCPASTATIIFFPNATQTIKGNLTITATGTGIFRIVNNGVITLNGNLIVNGGTFQGPNNAANGVLNVLGNTSIGVNGKLDLNAGTYSQRGNTFTNNGTLTGTAGTLQFLNFTGSSVQTLDGSGTVLTNIGTISLQNTAGLTISHSNQIILGRVNLFQGTITNSNKITFGTGSVNCLTQIGATGLLTPGGNFDSTPTFNLGTGTYSVIYAQESVARTAGFEIPSTRSITALTLSNSNGLTISGGALATGTLTFSALSGGNINTTSSNLLTVTGTATTNIVRTLATAYVNGPLAITLPASLATGSTYVLPIGKGSLNPFALVNPTTNSGGTVTVKAEVFDTDAAGIPGSLIGSLKTNRYWAASVIAGNSNFTDTLIQLNDTPAGADAIAASSTQNGAYDLVGGVAITSTASSLTSTAPKSTTLPGFFVMSNKAAASLSNLVISPTGNQCANVARTVTVTATPGGGAVSGVVINYSVNGTAQTAITMTNTSGNDWSGTIPTVTPANATVVWSVTATDVNTLQKSANGITYKDEPNFGAAILATASVNPLCAGSPTVLQANISGLAIGLGASTSSAAPMPFNGGYGGNKTQMLFTAAELSSVGLVAGNITSFSLDFSAIGTTYNGFGISVGNTALSALTSNIEGGLTSVYSAASVTPTLGINKYTFSTPFNWDGTSNIIVSICWSNGNTSNTSATLKVDTTSNVSVVSYRKDSESAVNLCSFTGAVGAGTYSYTTGSARPRAMFDGFVPTSWSDGTNVVATTQQFTATPLVNTTYTATMVINGCLITSNSVTVSTNVTPLSISGVTPSSVGICVGNSTTFTANPANGCVPYTYSWSDGTNVVGTSSTLTVSPTANTTYTVTVTDNTGATVTASGSVTVNNPQPASVTGETKCGISASFVLNATPGSGTDVLNWYAVATGGTVLATGTTFTTPLITSTKTYYVENAAITGSSNPIVGNSLIDTTLGTTGSPDGGMVFSTTVNDVKINSIDVLVSGTGNMTFELRNNAGTVIATSTQSVTGVSTAFTNVVLPSNFIAPTAATGYKILCTSKAGTLSWYYQTGTFPMNSTPSGLSITSGYGWSATTTELRCIHKINATITNFCKGTRVPVTATLNAPPAFALSTNAVNFCAGSASSVVTATGGENYDQYSWSPSTNVSGDVNTGFTFNPTTTTTYTLTASQSAGSCSVVSTVVVTVNPLPVISATATPASVCQNGIAELSAALIPMVYSFTASTGATLDPMTDATSVLGTSSDDTPTAAPANIGFTFPFNGINYTNYSVSPDGWILLGNSTASNQYTNAVTSSTNIPKLYPYWDDLATGTDGSVKTLLKGTAPNRIFIVEWNVNIPRNTTGVSNSKFQAWLYENSGKIEYRYGTMGTPTSGTISAGYTANVTNFNSISYSSNLSSVTTANDANSIAPASGTMYTYQNASTGVWSPTTDLYTDADATVAYTGGAVAKVYSKPIATTTYSVTMTNSLGCVGNQSVTVTQNAELVENITNGASAMCLGSSTVVDFENASVGVIWTSSNPTVATIDANGTVTALAVGTTEIGAKIVNPTTGCTSYSPNPQTINVYATPVVTSQPISQSILPNDSTSFSIAATGSIVGYQWKYSNDGINYFNLSNDTTYGGVTTNTLTVTNASLELSGLTFVCDVVGNAPCATSVLSSPALLTVSALSIVSNPASVVLCSNGSGTATFNIVFGGPTPDSIVWELYDNTTWTVLDDSSIGAFGTVTFTGQTTANLTLNGLSLLNNNWKVRANGEIVDPYAFVTSNEANITVNTLATIVTSPSNQTVCYSGGTSQFSATATGGTGYQWQYSSDGSTWNNVVNATPSGATYSNQNTSTLTVVTTSALPSNDTHFYRVVVGSVTGCSSVFSESALLNVNTPNIQVVSSTSYICMPGGTPAVLTASGASTYTWSPSTGLSATSGASITASPSVTTNYTVTGVDASGCSKTAQVTVIVGQAVNPVINASSQLICPSETVELTAFNRGSSTLPGTYCVPSQGGTSNIVSVSFNTLSNSVSQVSPYYNIYPSTGSTTTDVIAGQTYPLSIETNADTASIVSVWIDYNRNGLYEASEWQEVWTNAFTGAVNITIPTNASTGATGMRIRSRNNGSPNSSTDACSTFFSGSSQDYTINILGDSTGYTFAWTSTPAGYTSSASTINVTPVETTTYSVVVTSPVGCNNTVSKTITVQSGAIITTQPSASTICQGQSATLDVVATGSNLTYQWKKDGVNVVGNPTATTPSLTITGAAVSDSGSYTVLITPQCGSTVTSNPVALLVNPTPTVTAPSNLSLCSGSTTTPIALVGTPSGVTFDISGGAAIGLTNQTNVTSIPAFTPVVGSAVISLTPKSNGCTGAVVTFTITVNVVPTALTVTPASSSICANDSPVLLTATGGLLPSTSYCTPSMLSASVSADYITNFSFAGIVNNGTADAPTDYTYYSGMTANVVAGTAYPISITPGGTTYPQNFRVWIDMNHDGVFSASESVFNTTSSVTGPSSATGSVTIPTTAYNGITRMRVADRYSSVVGVNASCIGDSNYGEYEDYNVNITGGYDLLPVWTSTNGGLFTDLAGTIAYTGTHSASVYAKPSSSATITATVTVLGNCSVSSSSVLNVTQVPVLLSVSQVATVCPGANATINLTGLVANSVSTITYTINGGSSQILTGLTSNASGNASFILPLSAQNNGQVLSVTNIQRTDNSPSCSVSLTGKTVSLSVYNTYPFYVDADADGYGLANSTAVLLCSVNSTTAPSGYSVNNTDCIDNNPAVHPGAIEICYDGLDNNCNGVIDEGCTAIVSTVQATQCATTLAKIDDFVYANLVAGAQGYRFRVTKMISGVPSTNPADVQTIDRALRVFAFTQLSSYAFNTSYQVEVSIKYNNVWQPFYGNPCVVSTPATTTVLQTSQCGGTLTAMSDVIYANIVPYATGYRFKVVNLTTSNVQTIDRALREFRMNLLVNPAYNTTYSVEIAVRNTDGTYLPYGSVCNITTPAFPTTQLQLSQCDYTPTSSSEIIYADAYTGTAMYRFRFSNTTLGYTYTVDRVLRTITLSSVPGLLQGSTYTVDVSIKLSGEFGPYGKQCSLTVPGVGKGNQDTAATQDTVLVQFKAIAYPNPFAENFKLDVKTSSDELMQIRVYDMLGKLIEDRKVNISEIEAVEVGTNYPSGVYNVIVNQGENVQTLRVVKR